jgi:hypothetical protein
VSWRLAFASVVGTSHVAAGKACDDAACCDVVVSRAGEEILVAIVSDGAGSAELSSYGSKLTTEVMFENIKGWIGQGGSVGDLAKETVLDWLDNVRDRIGQLAKDEHCELRDFAATLLFAILGPNAGAIGQIGDGAVVVSENGMGWDAVFWPQHGAYVNQTYFVTDERAHEQLALKIVLRPIEDVVIFTDGLERVLLDFTQERAHPPAFRKMMAPLRAWQEKGHAEKLSAQLAQYLQSPAIASHSDDDLTLVICTRRSMEATATDVA